MNVYRQQDRAAIERANLVFGIVAYAAGRLGREPVRSQGHVHACSRFSGRSRPEVFEIWRGRAFIYLQEFAADDPGRAIAIDARPGDRVVAPPGWAHAVISADPENPLVFGAWCVADYGFVYDELRRHGGIAWFPLFDDTGDLQWKANPRYRKGKLEVRGAREYPELDLRPGLALYSHVREAAESLVWVSHPDRKVSVWTQFNP